MTNCLNTADIVCNGAKSAFNGGLCGGMTEETGYVVDVTMTNCLNVGRLANCNTADSSFVGAILGRKNGNAAVTLTNVYAHDILKKCLGAWCNGNTWVSKTFVVGSNPTAPARRELF